LDISYNNAPKIKENSYFERNIIGQVVSFLVTIVKSILNLLKKSKDKIENYWKKRQQSYKKNSIINETLTLDLQKKTIKEASIFYENNSAHIEILRNDDVEKVYFILNPFCQFIPQVLFKFFFFDILILKKFYL